MATTAIPTAITKGGSFSSGEHPTEQVFTPADINDDQRLIGQTAEESS